MGLPDSELFRLSERDPKAMDSIKFIATARPNAQGDRALRHHQEDLKNKEEKEKEKEEGSSSKIQGCSPLLLKLPHHLGFNSNNNNDNSDNDDESGGCKTLTGSDDRISSTKVQGCSELSVKLPHHLNFHSNNNNNNNNSNDDEKGDRCKTPTGSDHRIPLIPKCPPAPRKPKVQPLASAKRKLLSCRRILRDEDLTEELDSLCAPVIFSDIDGGRDGGGKIKKSRRGD